MPKTEHTVKASSRCLHHGFGATNTVKARSRCLRHLLASLDHGSSSRFLIPAPPETMLVDHGAAVLLADHTKRSQRDSSSDIGGSSHFLSPTPPQAMVVDPSFTSCVRFLNSAPLVSVARVLDHTCLKRPFHQTFFG